MADKLVSWDSCWVVGHLVFLVLLGQKGNGDNLRCSDLSSLEESSMGDAVAHPNLV